MKSVELVQKWKEGLAISTSNPVLDIMGVQPSDTITMSYEMYTKLLLHPAFVSYYRAYYNSSCYPIKHIIPGRVMEFHTGHLIVVI